MIKEKNPSFISNILDNKINSSHFKKPLLLEKKNLTIQEKTKNLISAIEKNLKKSIFKIKDKKFLENLSTFWNNLLTHSNESNFFKKFKDQKQKLEEEAENLGEKPSFKKIYKKMESLAKLWPQLGPGNEFSGKIFKLFLDNQSTNTKVNFET